MTLAPEETRSEQLPLSRSYYGCGVCVLSSDEPDAEAFARALAEEATACTAGFALIFHSRSLMDSDALGAALRRHVPDLPHAGCSTAGEITPAGLEEGQVLAMLFPAGSFSTASTMVRDLSSSGINIIAGEVEALRRQVDLRHPQRGQFAVCLIDGLSFAEEAVASAIHWGLDGVPLIGASAGDDLRFETTTLLHNGHVASDSAVIVLVATDLPFHVFKTENFVATDKKLVVTASDPDRRRVREFNAANAAQEFAAAVGIPAGALTPMTFASHPVVVRVGGEYYCRSIQKVEADGALTFFCAIDDGIVLTLAEPRSLVETTEQAIGAAEKTLGHVDLILGFDCVLRRLDAINRQVHREMSDLYRARRIVGFGTYGEQYRSMHLNQTFTGIAFGAADAG